MYCTTDGHSVLCNCRQYRCAAIHRVLQNRAIAAAAAPCYGNEAKHFARHVHICTSSYSANSHGSSSTNVYSNCMPTESSWIASSNDTGYSNDYSNSGSDYSSCNNSSSTHSSGISYNNSSNNSSRSSSSGKEYTDAAYTAHNGYSPLARGCSFPDSRSSTTNGYSGAAVAAASTAAEYKHSDVDEYCFDKIAANCNNTVFEQQLFCDSSIGECDIDSDELLAVLQDAFCDEHDNDNVDSFESFMYSGGGVQFDFSSTTAATGDDC
jgi:hypothetical protein